MPPAAGATPAPPPQPPKAGGNAPREGTGGALYLSAQQVDAPALPLSPWQVPEGLMAMWQGRLIRVDLWIDEHGEVTRVELPQGDLPVLLREQLTVMLERTPFQPAMLKGRPVANFRQLELAPPARSGGGLLPP